MKPDTPKKLPDLFKDSGYSKKLPDLFKDSEFS